MNNEALYQERLDRIEKTIKLEPVERIPTLYMGIAAAPQNMGMTIAEYVADMEAARLVTLDYMDRLPGLDGINLHAWTRITFLLTALWLSHIRTPGRELPEDSLWQVDEKEVMSVEDYDLIINKGFQAFQNSHLPKVIDMVEFQEAYDYYGTNAARMAQDFRDRGYVPLSAGITTIPFEVFCGARSMMQFFLDLYRRPDKVKAAMDVALPDLIGLGIGLAQIMGIPRVWVGGWRAASAMVGPKIWNKFVFPYYHQIITALLEKGITPILHWDQDWTRDLVRLQELPAKKCVLNPDGMTDIRKFKELVGDRMAMMGDVPSSLFAVGTPDDIYNYVRDLVHDVGPTGLILCPGCDAPINTKPENMDAFVAASREFGALTA